MDNRDYDLIRRRKIENIVLAVYTLYAVCVSLMTYDSTQRWIIIVIEALLVVVWMSHLTDFRDYRFRAGLCAFASEFCVFLYCIFVNNDVEPLISVIGLTIIIGLYELPKLLIFPCVTSTLLLLHHIFISKTVPMSTMDEAFRSILEIAAIYITILVVDFLLKEEAASRVRLLDSIEELKAAEKSKDDFMANVSHELRTPINTICGMSEIALGEAKSEIVRENLEDIKNAGRNLLSVVSDILDYSELNSGKFALDEENYSLSSTINDVINMSIGKIGSKNIELIVNCDPTIPGILIGDEAKLKRVMVNLIENAIKYTDEGYVIVDISRRNEEYGINLCVKIKDTGIGMKPENLNKIFSDFTQLSSGRDRKEGGIGLGLTISRAIVELMGGFLTIDSKYGTGTQIQFTVPQKVEDATPIGNIDSRLSSVGIEAVDDEKYGDSAVRVTGRVKSDKPVGQMIMPRAHVMIVDDSFMNLKVIEGLLKPYRIRVTTALSGREALEKLVSRDYDFIFMDHMMPEMDGVECLNKIRSRDIPYYKNVPVIALTANAVAGAKEKFIELGFTDFISKPVELSNLEKMLKKYIPKEKISYAEEIEEVANNEVAAGDLVIGDLNVKKGLLYCGSVENYKNVLNVHATNGPDNIDKIRRLFDEKNITDYTIYIHALKSSMASIGAETLSEMAKDMEQAGKDGNLSYIEAHHEMLMEEYERIIAMLLAQNSMQMEISDMYMEADSVPITDEKFEEYIAAFEEAAYTFISANMLRIVDELREYSFNGHPLAPQLITIRRKIEMSDYMSALDALKGLRDRYRNR
ncbi:MAG: response regulator [Lachnospiraceae bacterium]|nr:response regulator [Lachnospiraceae bacterium]